MDERTSVALIQALADVWTAIRDRHPDVPGVVLLPAPAGGRANVLGHFAPLRWSPKTQDDGQLLHEVVVVAEHLNRPTAEIVETLIHEAAHALNFSRGIKDCSTNQYHNRRFRDAAHELGLDVAQVRHYGFAFTSLRPETAEAYVDEIDALEHVLVHRLGLRRLPPTPPGTKTPPDDKKPRSRSRKATCACDPAFIIRVSRKTMKNTTIRCESCGEPFRFA